MSVTCVTLHCPQLLLPSIPPHRRNFALIESETVEFGPGFNVITGDSGSGKSILIQAMGLVGGGSRRVIAERLTV